MLKTTQSMIGGLVLMMSGAGAQAAILSSGPVFHFGQGSAVCHVHHTGGLPVSGVLLQIVDANKNGQVIGNFIPTGTMTAGQYRNAVAVIDNSVIPACILKTAGTLAVAARLKGNLDIRLSTTQKVEIVAPLR